MFERRISVKVIAHRGASGYAPENTLVAFKKALDMGAKAVEFDVQMTQDGQLVVIHDYTLDRTTSGSGMIMDTDYEDIKEFDAGSWFATEYRGERVPLLKNVLQLFPADVEINIEIKKFLLDERKLEEDIYGLVKEMNMMDQVVFSSFDHHCLKNLRNYSDTRIGILISSSMIEPLTYMKSQQLVSHSINQKVAFIDKELVEDDHNNQIKVLSYTVNDRKIAEYFETIGVDGIFSNYPDIMSK